MQVVKIILYPDKKIIEADTGSDLLDVIQKAGVDMNSDCAGEGVCGKCKVLVKSGQVQTPPTALLSREEVRQGYVLACKTKILTDLEVEIPPHVRLDEIIPLTATERETQLVGFYSKAEEVATPDIIAESRIFEHSPLATKLFLKLPPPTLKDNVSDLQRIFREIRRKSSVSIMQTGLANLKKLGKLLRDANWEATVLLGKRNETTEIVLIEAGDTSGENYGIAVDVGTTTVVAELVDLDSEKVLGAQTTYNKQANFGADVITRIIYASEAAGLEKLHNVVAENINELISSLVRAHQIKLGKLTSVMCAGNMTMTHLLLGIDPTYLRREPYVPTANFVPVIRAIEADIKINPRGLLLCLPGVSSYVGGDITAGVVASGICEQKDISLFIDVGTNGEIVLGNRDWLVSCASSAGPAFEGSGVKCGMRAVKGAIQKMRYESKTQDFKYETVTKDATLPRGICGSGLIDVLASLLRAGIIDKAGKFKVINDNRLRDTDIGKEFVLIAQDKTDTGRDIVITEADIENLIRSKAAIYAAAAVLVRNMGLDFKKIKNIYIAGGFGNYLDIENAVFIGLLPDLPRDKFKFIGNSSLAGARLALLHYEALKKINDVARMMTYFELSADNSFMDEYTKALFLPHTDLEKFPTIMQKMLNN